VTLTTDYSSLVGVVVGALGAFGISVFTQWRLERHEQTRWKREEEQAAAARTYDHRREAYVAYMALWQERWVSINDPYRSPEDPHPPDDWLDPLWDRQQGIALYGAAAAREKAAQATNALVAYVHGDGFTTSSGERARAATDAFENLRSVARVDLGIRD